MYKISEIAIYLAEIIGASEKGIEKQDNWFARLRPYFDKKFGPDWREQHKEFWKDFDKSFRVSKDEIQKIM
jgi:hypothetical protein